MHVWCVSVRVRECSFVTYSIPPLQVQLQLAKEWADEFDHPPCWSEWCGGGTRERGASPLLGGGSGQATDGGTQGESSPPSPNCFCPSSILPYRFLSQFHTIKPFPKVLWTNYHKPTRLQMAVPVMERVWDASILIPNLHDLGIKL